MMRVFFPFIIINNMILKISSDKREHSVFGVFKFTVVQNIECGMDFFMKHEIGFQFNYLYHERSYSIFTVQLLWNIAMYHAMNDEDRAREKERKKYPILIASRAQRKLCYLWIHEQTLLFFSFHSLLSSLSCSAEQSAQN